MAYTTLPELWNVMTGAQLSAALYAALARYRSRERREGQSAGEPKNNSGRRRDGMSCDEVHSQRFLQLVFAHGSGGCIIYSD
jgi:hypothetical protein